MSLDKATVKNIANLARVSASDQDCELWGQELANILAFVEQLSELNTDRIEPMTTPSDFAPLLRADQVTEPSQAEQILGNAPLRIEGFFAVPKVIE